MLHANASPPKRRYPFYVRCAGKLRFTSAECGMRSAECQCKCRGAARPFTSIPHSALRIGLPHQRYSYVTDYLLGGRAHLVDRVLVRVPVRIIEVHHVDRVDPGLLE